MKPKEVRRSVDFLSGMHKRHAPEKVNKFVYAARPLVVVRLLVRRQARADPTSFASNEGWCRGVSNSKSG